MARQAIPDQAQLIKEPRAQLQIITTEDVDLNGTTTTLLTNPTASLRDFYVTDIILRNPSATLVTVAFSVGQNSADYNDVVVDAAHTIGTTGYQKLVIIATGAVKVAAGSTLVLKVNTAEGTARTANVDVIGYLDVA